MKAEEKQEVVPGTNGFFFPKANPPVFIKADTLKEALEELNKKDHG